MPQSIASSDAQPRSSPLEAGSTLEVKTRRGGRGSGSEILYASAKRAPKFLQSLIRCRADCEATYEAVLRDVTLIRSQKNNVDVHVERDIDTTLPVISVRIRYAPLLVIYVESCYGRDGRGVTFFVGRGKAARNAAVNGLEKYCGLRDFRVAVADVVGQWVERFDGAVKKYGAEKCVKNGDTTTTGTTRAVKVEGARNNKLTKSLASRGRRADTPRRTDGLPKMIGGEPQKQGQESKVGGTVGGCRGERIKWGANSTYEAVKNGSDDEHVALDVRNTKWSRASKPVMAPNVKHLMDTPPPPPPSHRSAVTAVRAATRTTLRGEAENRGEREVVDTQDGKKEVIKRVAPCEYGGGDGDALNIDIDNVYASDDGASQEDGEERNAKEDTICIDDDDDNVVVVRKSRKRVITLECIDDLPAVPRKRPRVTTHEAGAHRVDDGSKREWRREVGRRDATDDSIGAQNSMAGRGNGGRGDGGESRKEELMRRDVQRRQVGVTMTAGRVQGTVIAQGVGGRRAVDARGNTGEIGRLRKDAPTPSWLAGLNITNNTVRGGGISRGTGRGREMGWGVSSKAERRGGGGRNDSRGDIGSGRLVGVRSRGAANWGSAPASGVAARWIGETGAPGRGTGVARGGRRREMRRNMDSSANRGPMGDRVAAGGNASHGGRAAADEREIWREGAPRHVDGRKTRRSVFGRERKKWYGKGQSGGSRVCERVRGRGASGLGETNYGGDVQVIDVDDD